MCNDEDNLIRAITSLLVLKRDVFKVTRHYYKNFLKIAIIPINYYVVIISVVAQP